MVGSLYIGNTKRELKDLTFSELEQKLYENSRRQKCIEICGLSKEASTKVLKELREEKIALLKIMQGKIVDLMLNC